MSYENILIQEATGEVGGWSLDRTEATAEWFDDLCSVGDSDTDVRVFPAVSENARGAEAEPYTHEEAETRRKEAHED